MFANRISSSTGCSIWLPERPRRPVPLAASSVGVFKVATHPVEARLHPQAIIHNYTPVVSCAVALLSYFAGRSDHTPSLGWLTFGILFGLAVAASGGNL